MTSSGESRERGASRESDDDRGKRPRSDADGAPASVTSSGGKSSGSSSDSRSNGSGDGSRSRGRVWFEALTGAFAPMPGDPRSVLTADADLGGERARFLCVVPDPAGRFPRARQGEVGLEEAWTLAARVREVLDAGGDATAGKRPLIAIVDVRSQAYGRREEIAAIYLAAAAAADAYASARMAGHPVIALIAGSALSGAFLAHGYQANRILAFDDAGVMVHAMHKEAAARVTRRSVAALEALGSRIAPLSYDIHGYAKLGLLHKLLHVEQPDAPAPGEVDMVRRELIAAVADARQGPRDLRHRLDSPGAIEMRRASREVRRRLQEQWDEPER
jgi:biotin-independent malonate decarboxylase gamma subunit